MKRRVLLACALTIELFAMASMPNLYFGLKSDLENPLKKGGKMMFSYNFSPFNGYSHQIRMDYFLNEHWSLLYNAGYSFRHQTPGALINDSYQEYRAPIGLSFGLVFTGILTTGYCYGIGEGLVDFITITAMIPDGVACHFPVSKHFSFSPYVLLSGLTFQRYGDNRLSAVYSPVAGVRLIYQVTECFAVSAEQNLKRTARNGFEPSVSATVAIAI